MTKIEREKATVEMMIRLYCRKKEGNSALCDECRSLLEYAHRRLEACRYGVHKTACKKCPTHCYGPAPRARIREVMRFAGPRLIFYHPMAAIRHLLNR